MTVFQPRPLPDGVDRELRARLARAHRACPFSTLDPRATIRRVVDLLGDLPVRTTVYRGGLDLRGAEVDHVWLALEPGEEDGPPAVWVLDAAYPLFATGFVDVLRRFVAGDAAAEELAAAAAGAGVEQRVLGLFPPPTRYRGTPVWAERAPTWPAPAGRRRRRPGG